MSSNEECYKKKRCWITERTDCEPVHPDSGSCNDSQCQLNQSYGRGGSGSQGGTPPEYPKYINPVGPCTTAVVSHLYSFSSAYESSPFFSSPLIKGSLYAIFHQSLRTSHCYQANNNNDRSIDLVLISPFHHVIFYVIVISDTGTAWQRISCGGNLIWTVKAWIYNKHC